MCAWSRFYRVLNFLSWHYTCGAVNVDSPRIWKKYMTTVKNSLLYSSKSFPKKFIKRQMKLIPMWRQNQWRICPHQRLRIYAWSKVQRFGKKMTKRKLLFAVWSCIEIMKCTIVSQYLGSVLVQYGYTETGTDVKIPRKEITQFFIPKVFLEFSYQTPAYISGGRLRCTAIKLKMWIRCS